MRARAWCQICDWLGPWHESEGATWLDLEKHEDEEHGPMLIGVGELEEDR